MDFVTFWTVSVWPGALCFIAYCVYTTYQSAKRDEAYQLNYQIGKLQLENRDLIAKIELKADNDLNEAEKRLEKLYVDLDAKVTVIQNGLQWTKK